jgi:N-carbamoyl-L-amino-acid hydrolase
VHADRLGDIVSSERLAADLAAMASFTDPEQPGATRRPFTEPYRRARRWLGQQMEAAGLAVRLDATGNLVGRRGVGPGQKPLPPIVIGSHTDTVLGGGRFDGVIGVLGGLELVRCLQELGIELRHPLELVDFLAEEPTEFGISTVGSRGMVGALKPEYLRQRDRQGRTLAEAILDLGGRPDQIAAEVRRPGSVAAYLEMHIEQGPVLDAQGIPLAAVTGIAGIRRYEVVVEGQASHAGTTPMALRRDALVAASRFVTEIERLFRAEECAVGTVGYLAISPNMPNVVPGRAELVVEMRSIDPQVIDRLARQVEHLAAVLSAEREIPITAGLLTDAAPVRADPRLLEITTQACRQTARDSLVLPSGAGHDGMQIATIAPIGMIFVPSRQGRSHCPEEWTEIRDIALGVQALLRAVLRVDQLF